MTRAANTTEQALPAGRPYIGGQAVLEGVMMRSPASFAIVVRRRDGSLTVRERPVTSDRIGAAKLPLLRGVMSLVESLKLGSEALRFSADQVEKDLDLAGAASSALRAVGMTLFALANLDGESPVAAPPSGKGDSEKGEQKKGGGAMGFMLVIMVAFLIALPQVIAWAANSFLHLGLEMQSARFQIITGVFKLAIVIGYLLLIRRVAEIRRVFQYHGAEHKTITTYEAREELTVANARTKTTLHPRCGTTFLVMVAIVSILVFTLVGGILPKIDTGNGALNQVVFFLVKLPFLPLIAAVTFELQRFFARFCTTGPLRLLLWPGFLVQKITTIEPDDDQLEVALASLRATLFRENGEGSEVAGDVTFPSYDAIARAPRLRAAA